MLLKKIQWTSSAVVLDVYCGIQSHQAQRIIQVRKFIINSLEHDACLQRLIRKDSMLFSERQQLHC